jgi:fumarate reductase subunit D
VRWSVFFGILLLFLAYMVIGYWHAKKRINKGLKPLAYHRVSSAPLGLDHTANSE